jgi:hypothetical protein
LRTVGPVLCFFHICDISQIYKVLKAHFIRSHDESLVRKQKVVRAHQ